MTSCKNPVLQDLVASDPLPLILIGSGRTLQLRNVKIVYAASLAACLQLGAGECLSSNQPVVLVQHQQCMRGSHHKTSMQADTFLISRHPRVCLRLSAQPCRLWSGVYLAGLTVLWLVRRRSAHRPPWRQR